MDDSIETVIASLEFVLGWLKRLSKRQKEAEAEKLRYQNVNQMAMDPAAHFCIQDMQRALNNYLSHFLPNGNAAAPQNNVSVPVQGHTEVTGEVPLIGDAVGPVATAPLAEGTLIPETGGDTQKELPTKTNAFHAYCKQVRPLITAEHPNMSKAELYAYLCAQWKDVPAEVKATYTKKAVNPLKQNENAGNIGAIVQTTENGTSGPSEPVETEHAEAMETSDIKSQKEDKGKRIRKPRTPNKGDATYEASVGTNSMHSEFEKQVEPERHPAVSTRPDMQSAPIHSIDTERQVDEGRKRSKKAKLQKDVPQEEQPVAPPAMNPIAEQPAPVDTTVMIPNTPEPEMNLESETAALTPKKSTPRKKASTLKKVTHPVLAATNVSLEQLLGVGKANA